MFSHCHTTSRQIYQTQHSWQFSDFIAKEDLLNRLPMNRRTKYEYISNTFETCATEINTPVSKLYAMTTDEAAAKMGGISGLPPARKMNCFRILYLILVLSTWIC
jgi:hypothetical protein